MKDTATKQPRSYNALVHGLYSKDVLLPWDSRKDFEILHSELKAEFSPSGRAEEEAVLDLALLHWQKQTVWRMRKTAILRDPFTSDIVETKRKSWSGIRKCLRAAANDQRTLQGEADAQIAKILSQIGELQQSIADSADKEEVKNTEGKLNALLKIFGEYVGPLREVLSATPNAEQAFDNAYAPESLEKIVRLEAALDARINKVLTRLVGLKEFKRTPAGAAKSLTVASSPELQPVDRI